MNSEEWYDAEYKKIEAIRSERTLLKREVESEREELDKARKDVEHALMAQDVISRLAQAIQQRAHDRIASVVSSCLSSVFDDPYEFKISFEQKRGRTEARLRFSRDGMDVNPMNAAGGGMVDVAAFALRAACLVLHRPRLRRLLVLDEPFKFVSEDFQPRIRSMLEQMAKNLDLQIVMITHNRAYETGEIVEL